MYYSKKKANSYFNELTYVPKTIKRATSKNYNLLIIIINKKKFKINFNRKYLVIKWIKQ